MFSGLELFRAMCESLGVELARLRGVDFPEPSDQSQIVLVGIFLWFGGHGRHSWRPSNPKFVAVATFVFVFLLLLVTGLRLTGR